MNPEPYPTGADQTDAPTGPRPAGGRSWPTVVAIVVIVGVLVSLIVLHLVFGGGFRGAH